MLSARAGEEARIEGLQAGADDYLVKPFSARELRARVERRSARRDPRRRGGARTAARRVFRQAPVAIAILRGPEHVYEFANAPYLGARRTPPILGKPIREALPELADQGIASCSTRCTRSGQPFSSAPAGRC